MQDYEILAMLRNPKLRNYETRNRPQRLVAYVVADEELSKRSRTCCMDI